MPDLSLDLFGGPRLRRPDGDVSLSPYQRFALLAVGTHTDGGLKRDRLAWLLWEEDATPAARQRIRQLLHALRRRTGVELFEEHASGAIRLDTRSVMSDLSIVEDHLTTGRLQEAAEIVARGLGAELPPPPTREYADWLEAVRVGTERRVREAAAHAWDRARPENDWTVARDAAEAAHLLAPQNEAALRMVVEARGATGSLQGAEAAFSLFEARLPADQELHPSTLDLVDRIRSLQQSLEQAEVDERLPLVGRGAAMATLGERVRRIREGSFEIGVIRGEAGIGKSRLLDEVQREARLNGILPLHARAVEPERRIAMNTIIDALQGVDVAEHAQRLGEPWRTLVAVFLPPDAAVDRLPAIPEIQEGSLSRRLLDAFTMLLTSMATERPIVFCIDDLQWVDDTSLAVLHFARRRWTEGRIGIVGTLRSEDAPLRQSGSGALAEFLAMESFGLDLGELDDQDARRLIHLTAGQELPDDVTRRIGALGGRNPFYLIELTKDHEAGRLATPAVPTETVAIPMSLQELFDRRFDGLGLIPQRLAELLTVRARPMAVGELATLADVPVDRCALAVDRLLANRLVRVEGGRVSVRHELFRSAFYRRISPARVALLHDRIADHILATQVPAPSGEVALHFAKAGRGQEAIWYGRAAADEAMKRGVVSEAAYFLEMIVENETDEGRRAEASADLAQLLHANREMARAAPLLELASIRLRRVGRPGRALRMEVRRVESRAEIDGVPLDRSLATLATIKEEARSREDWEAEAIALDAELHLLHQEGDVSGIRHLFEQMRECARKDNPAAACLAHSSLALNILFGDADEALASAREAVQLAEEEGLNQHLLMAQTRLVVVLTTTAQIYLPEGQDLVRRFRSSTRNVGDLGVLLDANLATFYIDAGDLEEAQAAFARVEPIIRKLSIRWPRFNFYFNRAELAVWNGHHSEALEDLLVARDILEEAGSQEVRGLLDAAQGLCELEVGALGAAREHIGSSLSWPNWFSLDPTFYFLARSRHLERTGRKPEALEFLRATVPNLRSRFTGAWVKLSLYQASLAHREGNRLEATSIAQSGLELSKALNLRTREYQFTSVIADAS